jgi:hypothetical protein
MFEYNWTPGGPFMSTRSAFSILAIATALCVGCAVGEPIGELELHELGEIDEHDDASAVREAMGQLFVDVADPQGEPLLADAVWISIDDGELEPAGCMEAGEAGCDTWIAELAVPRRAVASRVTAFAEVCGLLHLASVSVASEEMPGFAAHLVVVADDAACRPDRVTRR